MDGHVFTSNIQDCNVGNKFIDDFFKENMFVCCLSMQIVREYFHFWANAGCMGWAMNAAAAGLPYMTSMTYRCHAQDAVLEEN